MGPFVLLIISNTLIIYKATHFDRTHSEAVASSNRNGIINKNRDIKRQKRNKLQMTRTILCITILFIVLTTPGVFINGVFYNQLRSLNFVQMLVNIATGFSFSYQAFNFFILYFSNKMFAAQVKVCLFGTNENNA